MKFGRNSFITWTRESLEKERIQSKRCPGCKNTKPYSEFNKNRSKKSGIQSRCKQCEEKYYQEHRLKFKQYYHEHKREQQKYDKQYYKTIEGHLRKVFRAICYRCNNPKNKAYKYYGGRGIRVKFASFEDFFDYVINEIKADPRGLTIDRINNDGDYEPSNIRFVTQAENNRNKKRRIR